MPPSSRKRSRAPPSAGAAAATKDLVRVGVGGASTTGAASSSKDLTRTGAGGASTAGTATVTKALERVGAGGASSTGSASASLAFVRVGSGGASIAGSIPGLAISFVGSGGLTSGGSAPFSVEFAPIPPTPPVPPTPPANRPDGRENTNRGPGSAIVGAGGGGTGYSFAVSSDTWMDGWTNGIGSLLEDDGKGDDWVEDWLRPTGSKGSRNRLLALIESDPGLAGGFTAAGTDAALHEWSSLGGEWPFRRRGDVAEARQSEWSGWVKLGLAVCGVVALHLLVKAFVKPSSVPPLRGRARLRARRGARRSRKMRK